MKTFKQFIAERQSDLTYLLETNCAPFLEESKRQGFLYRGIKGLSKIDPHLVMTEDGQELVYTIKTVRSDRKPLDTTHPRHEALDAAFSERFGWKPRSEGVFCFGEDTSVSDIRTYGEPCIIFPIGPIKYVWSKFVEDLYVDLRIKHGENLKKEINEWLDNASYQDNQLDEAVLSRNELMVKCDKYYAFPIKFEHELKTALGIS